MKDIIRIHGIVDLEELNILTGEKKVTRYKNMIMQSYYDLIFKFLNTDNESVDLDAFTINRVALGTGTTAVTSTDTKLAAEIYRKLPTTKTRGNSSFVTKVIIAPADAVGNIKEIGIFAKGTNTADSGTLLSRLLIDKQKTALLQWTILYSYILS